MKPIYLDYNATTPAAPEVISAMRPYLEEHFGNPSSSHWYGAQTKSAVEKARLQVAHLLGCGPEEIVFTSGGSESNNFAITGTALALQSRGNHIITSSVEHPAVSKVCSSLEERDFQVTYLPVDHNGMIDPYEVQKAITPQTILITIMHANNEVGTIQPISEIAAMARDRGIIMHTDAAQSIGKIPTEIQELKVDLLSMAGHKLYGPKGVGALYIRSGVELVKLILGAPHERDRRAGTENVFSIVGLGQACESAARNLKKNMSSMKSLRDRLHRGLKEKIPDLKLNGHPENRLPNTLSIGFPHIMANNLLSETTEIAASPGAACHSDSIDISHVLKAMSVSREYAMGTVRFSVGKMTSEEEIDRAIEVVSAAVKRLRS